MKKICIITQSHLCRNPRVFKEAVTLAESGYLVTIINTTYSSYLQELDYEMLGEHSVKIISVADLSLKRLQSISDRIIYKIGRWMVRFLKFNTFLALGYGVLRYYKQSILIDADLYICHQELATYIGVKLALQGKMVAFDFEDWYSKDLLPDARRYRPINLLEDTERLALKYAVKTWTTSKSMAIALSRAYDSVIPEVIYNVFPSNHEIVNTKKDFSKPLTLVWFSQTVGEGRGLEEFLKFLESVDKPVELHLIGEVNQTYKDLLCNLLPKRHQMIFHPLIKPGKLTRQIANFDVGLALEHNFPESRNLTITNKVFQYLQAGLPIIATNTAGQKEIFNEYTPGFIFNNNEHVLERLELNDWLQDSKAIIAAKEIAIEAAKDYNWEKESIKLKTIIQEIFET